MNPLRTVDFDDRAYAETAAPDVPPVLTPAPLLTSTTSAVPQLYGEIRELYHRRLREVGLIGGGTWWLLFCYFATGVNPVMNPGTLGTPFLATTAAPIIAFPAAFIWLTARKGASNRALRAVEWVLVVTTLFPLLGWRYASVTAAMAPPLDGTGAMAARFATAYCNFPCTAMIIVYGVFVPNTRRRTAGMLALLAAGVIATDLVAWLPHLPDAAPVFADSAFLTGMMLFLSLGVAFYGAFKVGALQQEALAAREQARRLGQYRLARLLGSGAMGEVYMAEHQLLKRPCAVKLVRADRAGDPKALARFEREVRSIARLTHPNVIEIYDYGRTEDGTFFYAMEYLQGLTLEEVVRRYGRLPPGRALYLFSQLCAAVRAAHGHGLVHRDIKPSNIFSSRQGDLCDVLKLLDFGLVHAMADSEQDGRLTQDGGILGTPEYMSPEQADGSCSVDGRADIYAMGAVLYFMLTGRPPFVHPTIVQTLIAHRQETPRPLLDWGCEVSAALEDLVRRCLAKTPADRFLDAGQAASAAAACPENQGWSDDMARRWWESHWTPECTAETNAAGCLTQPLVAARVKSAGGSSADETLSWPSDARKHEATDTA